MQLLKRIEAQERALDRWLGVPQQQPEERDISFRGFIALTDPHFQFYWHCEVQIDVLERFLEATIKRIRGEEPEFPEYLLTFEPVRHGKSEIMSRKFPAYCLFRYPWLQVGLCSYGADLAYGFSRDARSHYQQAGGVLSGDSKAVQEWQTDAGGKMWAAGVGGAITGKGYHIGIIDDYLKNWEDAASTSTRVKQWDWLQSTFHRRKEPGAGTAITATRWHEDDMAGRFIAQEKKTKRPKSAHVIHWPAIKESVPKDYYPKHFTIEDDPRSDGEALCPERYTVEDLEDAKADSSFFFSALYQQRPAPMEGAIWKATDFRVIADEDIPDDLIAVEDDWDLAYTKEDKNSASAFVRSGRREVSTTGDDGERHRETFVYVLEVGHRFNEFPEQVTWMASRKWPHNIEAKASGKSAKQSLDRRGILAKEVPVQGGDKEARTHLVRPVGESGHLYVAKSAFDALLYDDKQGVLQFPGGSHDDVNDALVQAINRHTKPHFSGEWGEVAM